MPEVNIWDPPGPDRCSANAGAHLPISLGLVHCHHLQVKTARSDAGSTPSPTPLTGPVSIYKMETTTRTQGCSEAQERQTLGLGLKSVTPPCLTPRSQATSSMQCSSDPPSWDPDLTLLISFQPQEPGFLMSPPFLEESVTTFATLPNWPLLDTVTCTYKEKEVIHLAWDPRVSL